MLLTKPALTRPASTDTADGMGPSGLQRAAGRPAVVPPGSQAPRKSCFHANSCPAAALRPDHSPAMICRAEPRGMSSAQLASEVDEAFLESMNQVSNQAVQCMLDNNSFAATDLNDQLQATRQLLEGEGDIDSSRFLRVLQGMLSHTLLGEAARLEGIHALAFNRICNQVAGSEWKLVEEGKSAEVQDQEPQFSTWDDVMNAKQGRSKQQTASSSTARPAPSGSATDDTLYRLLDVARLAPQADIKSAYRKLALRLHPDVNDAADATERFLEISNAYDVLSDESSRALYDKFGLAGMQQHGDVGGGRGNARRAWDEFKPHKRENKRTRARGAAAEANSSTASTSEVATDSQPQVGAVVEYPLRDMDCTPSRTLGVGLLVGRNMDRGDARKLPPDQLDLCEIEPLQQQEPDSVRWIPDQLGYSSFARLGDLRVLPVSEYDQHHDIWVISGELSAMCSGPELPEEIML